MTTPTPALVRRPSRAAVARVLDDAQRRVVEHRGGPLLVLAGPGTGKTTVLVESVVARVQEGLAPEQVLVLTFSRKAALELRTRVAARLGRTTRGALALTFHSYAFALLRRELGPGLRLLSGAEHDLEVGRLLAGERLDGATSRWPAALQEALPLRGFRQELRDLLLRAQERGVEPARLAELGRRHGRPEWEAAAGFLADYESRFDLDPNGEVLDYAGLVRTAAGLLESDDDLRARERAARAVVLVDELQDADPAQLRLLQALAGDGRDLVGVGDPDQSIYGFRGADPRAVLRFGETFRTAAGAPAPVVALQVSRRAGAVLLAVSRSVAAALPATRLPAGFRQLTPAPGTPAGRVEVRLAGSAAAEAALVADVLRRAHLQDGVPWSQMAVLVRSGLRSASPLRRALAAGGVPVAVARDEVPLAAEPVVQALLAALSAALRPERLDEAAVLALLTGPLVRADALAVRRLRRGLREVELAGGGSTPSAALLVEAVRDPRDALLVSRAARGPLDRLQAALDAVRSAEGSVEDALWTAWTASGLATRLEAQSARGGATGAAADRALDAVLALFDAAARYVDRLPGASVLGFLDDVAAQEVPADTLAQRAPEGDAVRLLTAHASKGLEWRVVVVPGVQEGVWPDLRRRGSLLGADELDDVASGRASLAGDDPAVWRAALLAEERRLFYVAVTRASERLVVTAVSDGDERPSRFLDDLGTPVPAAPVPAPRPLTAAALVAELRRTAAFDPDPVLREAAAVRLAALAGAPSGLDVPRAPVAHPDRWWGLAPVSDPRPLALEGEVVAVSPSRVEAFDTCALRWLLTGAVGVAGDSGPAQVVGSLVHALAELASGPEALDETALSARLDAVLPTLDLGAPWAARVRREEALDALGRFVRWARRNPRELVGTELDLRVPVGERGLLTGRVDRLEVDEHGRGVVVDLKTSSSKPSAAEVARHPQLGAYQLAVELGGFAERGVTSSGGASLLQLKKGRDAAEQHQPTLADDPEPAWAAELVARVVDGMAGEAFPATAGDLCSRCVVRSSCPAWPEGAGVVG